MCAPLVLELDAQSAAELTEAAALHDRTVPAEALRLLRMALDGPCPVGHPEVTAQEPAVAVLTLELAAGYRRRKVRAVTTGDTLTEFTELGPARAVGRFLRFEFDPA
jgi:hypothetical protein